MLQCGKEANCIPPESGSLSMISSRVLIAGSNDSSELFELVEPGVNRIS